MNKKIFILLLVFILTSTYLHGVVAQKKVKLPIQVNPLVKELEMVPGSTIKKGITIKSTEEKPISVTIAYRDFRLTKDGNLKLIEAGKSNRSLGSYINFSSRSFILDPGGEREIEYKINLPNSADKPHWGTLIIAPKILNNQENGEGKKEKEEMKFKINFKYSYRHVIIQRSTNSPPPQGRMANLTITGTGKDKVKETTLEATFSNTGKAITKCQGYVEIFDDKGQKIKRYDFVQDRFVFPKSKRTFSQSLSGLDLKSGEYLAVAIIDFGGENVVGGRYRFTIPEGI